MSETKGKRRMSDRDKLDAINDELAVFALTADPNDRAEAMVKRECALIQRIGALCAPDEHA